MFKCCHLPQLVIHQPESLSLFSSLQSPDALNADIIYIAWLVFPTGGDLRSYRAMWHGPQVLGCLSSAPA